MRITELRQCFVTSSFGPREEREIVQGFRLPQSVTHVLVSTQRSFAVPPIGPTQHEQGDVNHRGGMRIGLEIARPLCVVLSTAGPQERLLMTALMGADA